jgi:hypothetical protein
MTKPKRNLALLLLLVLAAAPVAAEEVVPAGEAALADEASMELLLATIRSNEKAFVAVNLALDDEQASLFWPLYDTYQAELTAMDERLAKIIEEYKSTYGSTTDEQAGKLIDEYLTLERDRAAVRLTYEETFAAVLPGRTLMRFFQIENKIDAVTRYELAASIPVVEQ